MIEALKEINTLLAQNAEALTFCIVVVLYVQHIMLINKLDSSEEKLDKILKKLKDNEYNQHTPC